jgi:D-alanyl-lipoteichoic acid acyltransferase DltB (MBOAT superfamily)
MPFTSWDFLLYFLPLTVVAFHLIPPRCQLSRKLLLVVASMVFYAWFSFGFAALLVVSMGFNYLLAEWIGRKSGSHRHWPVAIAGICANLLLLFHFKYSNMFKESLGSLFGVSFEIAPIVLPLAISFYTFTQIGYVIDVAKKPSLRCGFVDYCLFVVFFPHLIAGPVVRHSEIVPQYADRDLKPDWGCLATGTAIFLVGLYKKTLLADPVGVHADWIFNHVAKGDGLTWFSAWIGSIAYGLQIYFDFSGYSDMAIGLAIMFAIRFPVNFDSPYKSLSISDFWKRWHMSLTRFFRDYLYIPLGGNRGGFWIQTRNILLVFLISGLWHGAGWTFVIWGALHGLYLATHLSWKSMMRWLGWKPSGHVWTAFAWCLTMAAVMFAWVFFRSHDVASALRMSHAMLGFDGIAIPGRWAKITTTFPFVGEFIHGIPMPNPPVGWFWLCLHLIVLSVIVVALPNSRQLFSNQRECADQSKIQLPEMSRLGIRHGLAAGILLTGFLYSRFSAVPSPFIYFNF